MKDENVRLVAVTQMERLTAEEEARAFCVGEEHPLWRAVMGVLADYEIDARVMVGSPGLADKPGALARVAGQLDYVLQLVADLESRRRAARGKVDEKV